MRFLSFWGRALLTGGRLAIALGSLVALAIGGSAVAYFQAAHHRSVWVVIGAAVVIVACMWAAYRCWDEADREAAWLRQRLSQTSIHPDHAAQLRAVLDSCRRGIANLAPCDYIDDQFHAAFRARTIPTSWPRWRSGTQRLALWNQLARCSAIRSVR